MKEAPPSPARIFPDYRELPRSVPMALIHGLRAAAFLAYLVLIALLLIDEKLGLMVFWCLAVPVLPAVFVVAPGLWRAVCPMALANQTPQLLNIAKGRRLSPFLANRSFTIAVALFIAFIVLRRPLLNESGLAVALMLISAGVLAFLGGLQFAGRSGWCGTFCPLGPLQRDYGHAPAVLVPNAFCRECVGCQSKCYDFSPQATLFNDVHDEDARHSGQRRFFMSMMPGVVAGYFLQIDSSVSYPVWLAIFFGSTLVSVGLYQFAISFLGTEPARSASAFAALAISLFYLLAGPLIVNAIETFTDVEMPLFLVWAIRGFGFLLAASLLVNALRLARRYDAAQRLSLRAPVHSPKSQAHQVTDLASGRIFHAAPGESLLGAMSSAKLPVMAVCRVGQCGSDPLVVVEGAGNLSPAGPDERATLARLGLPDNARLACQCTVSGPVVIDTNVEKYKRAAAEIPRTAPRLQVIARADNGQEAGSFPVDPSHLVGVEHVVIIGNGIAGSTVAEELRRLSPSVRLTLISAEAHPFYNRMALASVATGADKLSRLTMLDPDWQRQLKVDVHLSNRIASIDRITKTITTLTGQTFSYDRLVLATGARPGLPVPGFLGCSNAFVLRNAGDALALHAFVQKRAPRLALIIGGGVLGVEMAEALASTGVSVGIIHRAGHLLDRHVDATGARMLERYLAGLHIGILTETEIERFVGDGTLTAAKPRRLPAMSADLFIAAIGNRPNIELAAQCGLAVRHGILVDAMMRTSDPSIFAIGDCSEQDGASPGLWPVAVAQAQTAAAAILGARQSSGQVTSQPVMQLKSKGIDLLSYGDVLAVEGHDEVVSAAAFSTSAWRFVLRNGKVAGASYVGPAGSAGVFRRVLTSGPLPPATIERLRAGHLQPDTRVAPQGLPRSD